MATSNITELRLEPGLWRPDAAVLCLSCHAGRTGSLERGFGSAGEFDSSRYTERPIDHISEYSDVGTCDDCGKSIWIDEKIAHEQRVLALLREHGYVDVGMQQTGGMCSAAEVSMPEDEVGGYKTIWITWDEESEFDDPQFNVGFYRTTNNAENDQEDYEGPMPLDEVLGQVAKWWKEK